MTTEIRSWQIIDGKLEVLDSSMVEEGRKEAYDLESWVVSNPSIIGPELVIIGRQVPTKSGNLDLLAIDKSGNMIIIELKRDILPREALAQAIDYASDIADWNLERISETCIKYAGKSLDVLLNESFPDINLEAININETQRIILVGFSIDSSLERMINWLSDNYSVNINAVLLKYTKTKSGDELLTRTSVISELVEQERIRQRKFQIPMSDEPGDYEKDQLKKLLIQYLSQDLHSARRIRKALLPACLERGKVTRDELKEEFVKYGEAESVRDAGYFIALVSQQLGMAKNDFLRQVIEYDYPSNPWEKDDYRIKDEYKELVTELLSELKGEKNQKPI